MGQQIEQGREDLEQKRFTQYLLKDLQALEHMLKEGMIESGVERIGAEQELCLVNTHWAPAPMAMEILKAVDDPHVVNEYALFNLEINLDPLMFRGSCLTQLEQNLDLHLSQISAIAQQYGADTLLVGILPTIRQKDLESGNMTPLSRYRTLDENLKKLRGGKPFRFYINGADQLIASHPSSLLESCNTSFQLHLQVNPEEFADKYNFAQLISAPVLAAGTNSPLLFGKRLWRETRIALFQQSIDTRLNTHPVREQTPRVTFGKSWVHESVLEIFHDDLSRFRQVISTHQDEDSLNELRKGKIPRLRALCLFNGTVYRWNRACYGITDGKPHLRIENRVLPAGPTVVDEIANTAFWLGLMKGMPPEYCNLDQSFSFDQAYTNFVEAAKTGVDTQFLWLKDRDVSAKDLILKELLPISREGLTRANIDQEDIERFLGILEERVKLRHTGSLWIFESFNKLLKTGTRFEAAVALTAGMSRRQKEGKPVHEWALAEIEEGRNWLNQYRNIEQIMSTDLFTVHEDDLVDLVTHIMKWKNVHHVPVEDEEGRLVGLVNDAILINYLGTKYEGIQLTAVNEIMDPHPATVTPDTPTAEALDIMIKQKVSCLPVVSEGNTLVGIVTENDFARIARELLRNLQH